MEKGEEVMGADMRGFGEWVVNEAIREHRDLLKARVEKLEAFLQELLDCNELPPWPAQQTAELLKEKTPTFQDIFNKWNR